MKSLYTNIPNREGIEVVKENLNARTEKHIETKVIKVSLPNIKEERNKFAKLCLSAKN